MKSFVAPAILSVLAIGASAYADVAPSQTTTTPSDPSATTCPAVYDPTCPFVCFGRGGPSNCRNFFTTGPGTPGCRVCPGHPSACPAVPDESCAYICEGKSPSLQQSPFCNRNNGTLPPLNPGEPNLLDCKPCGSGGNPSPTNPGPTYPGTNSTSAPPPPAYTGAASRLSIGGAAFAGLAAVVFLNF